MTKQIATPLIAVTPQNMDSAEHQAVHLRQHLRLVRQYLRLATPPQAA